MPPERVAAQPMQAALTPRMQLTMLGLAGFASMATMRLCDPMLVVLGQEFGVSAGEASAVVSAFAVAYGVLQLIYGPLGDRFGKLRVVAMAVSVCSVLALITSFTAQLDALVFMRALMGAAAAGIIPLSMAWIGDQVPYERRQETLAKLMGYTVSGMMVGLWFGGYAAQHWGWRSAFVVVSGLFALAAAMLWAGVRRGAQVAATSAQPVASPHTSLLGSVANTWALLRAVRVQQVLVVTAVEGALVFGAMAFIPTHLHQRFGLSVAAAASVMMLYGVGGLLYSQLARRWLQWLGGERGLARTGAVSIVLGLLTLGWAQHPALGLAACFATGFGFYMLHNTLQTQASQMAPPELPAARGTAVTLFASALFFGQSLGVLVFAASLDRGGLSWALTAAALGVAVLGRRVLGLVGLGARVGRQGGPA